MPFLIISIKSHLDRACPELIEGLILRQAQDDDYSMLRLLQIEAV